MKRVWAVVALSLLVRLPLVTWGLPLAPGRDWLHPDEHTVLLHARHFPLVLVSNREPQYPSGLGVMIRTAVPGASLALACARPWLDKHGWSLLLVVWGRFLTILLVALSLLALWKFTLAIGDGQSAFTAAVAGGFAVWSVSHSAFLTGDAAASSLFCVSLLALAGFVQAPSARTAGLAGCAAGAAASVKYMAGLAALPGAVFAILGAALAVRRGRWDEASHWCRRLALLAGSAALAFLALSPAFALTPLATWTVLLKEGAIVRNHAAMPWLEYAGYATANIWWVFGPAALLLPIGALRLARESRQPDGSRLGWCLLAMPLIFLLFLKGFYDRHLVFLLPALAAIAGAAVRRSDPGWWRACVAAVLAVHCSVAGFTAWQRASDVRQSGALLAALDRWAPPGTRVCAEQVWDFPELPGRKLVKMEDAPDVVLLNSRMDETYQTAARVCDPVTGQVSHADRWAFFKGIPPSRAAQDARAGLETTHVERARVDQPGSGFLRWYLEFFPHRFRIFVRKTEK